MNETVADELLARIARECAEDFRPFPSTSVPLLLADVPELASIGDELIREMVSAHAGAVHQLLARPVARDAVHPAPFTELFARTCAQAELPASTALSAYQRGHELLWHWWATQVNRRVADADARAAVISRLADLLMAYVSAGMALTVEVHGAEVAERDRGASWRRRTIVGDILARRSRRTVTELSRTLGYDLDRWHLGFVVWDEDEESEGWAGLEPAARTWAQQATEHRPLLIGVDDRVIWGWVAGPNPPTWAECPTPQRLRVAVGQPARAVHGFRLTHREAELARSFAERNPARVLRHDQLATVALLRDDQELLRRYVETTLGALGEPGARQQRLRATLGCYLQEGENVMATARAVRLHRNTVQQHLDQAAAMRGRPLHDDRLALAVALQILAHDTPETSQPRRS